MEDRELLELAARAAGLVVRWHPNSRAFGPVMEIMEGEEGGPPWNPLTDDGDALRLAVKLDLFSGAIMFHYRALERLSNKQGCEMEHTRRAIVRAAAEIGRAA